MGDILRGLGCLVLIGIMLFGLLMSWMTSHADGISAWADGVDKTRAADCEAQRAELQDRWTTIINGQVDNEAVAKAMEDEYRRVEAEVEARCGEL